MTCSDDGTLRMWDMWALEQRTVIKPTLAKPGRWVWYGVLRCGECGGSVRGEGRRKGGGALVAAMVRALKLAQHGQPGALAEGCGVAGYRYRQDRRLRRATRYRRAESKLRAGAHALEVLLKCNATGLPSHAPQGGGDRVRLEHRRAGGGGRAGGRHDTTLGRQGWAAGCLHAAGPLLRRPRCFSNAKLGAGQAGPG